MHSYSSLKDNLDRKHNARLKKIVGPATLKYYQSISTKLDFNDYFMKKINEQINRWMNECKQAN